MKQLILLVFCTITLFFAEAQSQQITGTLLPKNGKAITILPNSVTALVIVKQIDTKKASTKGFIFNKPVVQGQNNNQQKVVVPHQSPFTEPTESPIADARNPVVQLSSTPGQIIPTPLTSSTKKMNINTNEPLKYEEPSVVASNTINVNVEKSNENISSLIYTVPSTIIATNLKSPKIIGLYKSSIGQPIILVPIAPENIEGEKPKLKYKADSIVIAIVKTPVEDLYPPLIYTTPTAATNLRSPKIEGTYAATKNNPYIIMPIPPDTTTIPAAFIPENSSNTSTQAMAETQYQQPPQPIEIPQPTDIVPIQKTVKSKFQKPIKQSNNAQSNNQPLAIVNNTIVEASPRVIITNNTKMDYKFYLTPSGKYNIAFDALGGSVSVTSFGRVNDFAVSSTSANVKPTYNYRGLLDAVGSFPLQYNYEGRVAAVGATELSYNYNGAIDKVGNTPIYYNPNGTVDKIGNSKISYDYLGNIVNMDRNPMILVKQ